MKATAAIASSVLIATLVAVSGCGKGSENGAPGKSIGEKLEDALKIKVNVEKKTQLKIELADAAKALGLTMNVSKAMPPAQSTGGVLSVYLLSTKSLGGQLLAKALDKDGKEIGRAQVDLDLGNDDARYFNFQFPAEMDTRKVEAYQVDVKR